jgi:N-acetylglucosaminyldiphosphoundecaprenol N-acetyl-beta-D-mannosaminyltransferase
MTSACQAAVETACAHPYADVLGVDVSAINMARALEIAEYRIDDEQPGYVCVTGVHGVMEANRNPEFRDALNRAVMNVPDGMPISWVGWLQGFAEMDRVFGPDLMLRLCELSPARGYRHFLYGGQLGVAEQLKATLEARFPGLSIVGTFTPPFRPLNEEEEGDLLARVNACRPHVVWVGLSTPKQELFMARYVERLQVPLLIGVGAAFDYHTGRIRDCYPWIKRSGLQWLHRLLQDPHRLTLRYLRNNPEFVFRIALAFLKHHRHPVLSGESLVSRRTGSSSRSRPAEPSGARQSRDNELTEI